VKIDDIDSQGAKFERGGVKGGIGKNDPHLYNYGKNISGKAVEHTYQNRQRGDNNNKTNTRGGNFEKKINKKEKKLGGVQVWKLKIKCR
jgi:hypothetical protein